MCASLNGTVIQVADPSLEEKLLQARLFLQQARYKQAARLLDSVLDQQFMSLVDHLHTLAQRALANALWKKTDRAINDASQILNAVRADIDDLIHSEIDWDYEKSEDIGHLRFLADVFQMRGILHRLQKDQRRAVEDLTISIYMTRQGQDNQLSHLLRAAALIELEDCLEQALADLQHVWLENQTLVREWFDLPEHGEFSLLERGVCYHSDTIQIYFKPEKVRLRLNRVTPQWFRIYGFLGLE